MIKLFLLRSSNGACACTSTALDALVCIDYVLVISLGDAANRTLVSASAASDTLITNLESHQ